MSLQNLSKLEAYTACKLLRTKISLLVKQSFPSPEKHRLLDQLIRASRSSSANIAEGYGRFHFQENIQYARIARGFLYETLDHLSVAFDKKFIIKSTYHDFIEETEQCIRILNRYIKFLKKQKRLTNRPLNLFNYLTHLTIQPI